MYEITDRKYAKRWTKYDIFSFMISVIFSRRPGICLTVKMHWSPLMWPAALDPSIHIILALLCIICWIFYLKLLLSEALIFFFLNFPWNTWLAYYSTHNVPITTAADHIMKYIYFRFQKTCLDFSCESSSKQTMLMKCEYLLSLKKKK